MKLTTQSKRKKGKLHSKHTISSMQRNPFCWGPDLKAIIQALRFPLITQL